MERGQQQHGVRAGRPQQRQLPRVDDELLGQHRAARWPRGRPAGPRASRRTSGARRARRSSRRHRPGRHVPGRPRPASRRPAGPADGERRLISAMRWRPGRARRPTTSRAGGSLRRLAADGTQVAVAQLGGHVGGAGGPRSRADDGHAPAHAGAGGDGGGAVGASGGHAAPSVAVGRDSVAAVPGCSRAAPRRWSRPPAPRPRAGRRSAAGHHERGARVERHDVARGASLAALEDGHDERRVLRQARRRARRRSVPPRRPCVLVADLPRRRCPPA